MVAAVVVAAGITGAVYLLRRPPAPPDAGVPQALAQERASRISDLKYDVALTIPAARTEMVRGTIVATFALTDTSTQLAFDFAQPADHLVSVTANRTAIEPRAANGHVIIPSRRLVKGENTIAIEFAAGDEALNRADDFLYSLFVPARASLAMPVFDQPDLKARWRLRLDLPPGWTAVSNGREAGKITAPGRQGVIFDETEPISTYLFAFAAGKFSVEAAERNGRVFHMFHRETDAAKVARNKDAIFDLHARALEWLESYTGIPYPFGKFDFVVIPSFQFSGMEHPGAIYYNASSLLLDESATQNQLLGRANVISHETAHMWFGDLVTMKWFNDVWMKEVFANFMAAKIVNPSFPAVNHELRFFLDNYPSAYDVDRTDGANPIRQTLANLNEAGSLYGAIIYQKAPIAMRQLELLMGADVFRDGLREYLKAHAKGNATWSDLISLLDSRTDADLAAWSKAWVEERGRPRIQLTATSDGLASTIALAESDPLHRSLVWPERLRVALGYRSGIETVPIDLRTAAANATFPERKNDPVLWALPAGGGLGYGDFVLDAPNLAAIAAALPKMPDAVTRGAALVTLWESMLEGRVAPADMTTTVLTALPAETDELNVQLLLDQARALFWRFTAADDRADLTPKLEPILKAGLDRAKTTSLKSAWFGAIRSVAMQPATVAWLEQVWRRQVKVPGLPLAEPDEAALALDLAVRDVPAADEILTAQRDRFTNPDRKARFIFVMPALSRDAAVREKFFAGLADVNNRRHEAWVLEAARYLHHPLRAAASKKLVKPALDMVLEIQRTGDIFFPKRWADATLSGYQSIQTAADVRAFIDALPPDYPPRLRWVLEASADPLFRAAKLLNQ
jgi:aminopeptidase N